MLPSLTLVLGGAASGKSAYGEQIVKKCGLNRVYLATAQAFDDEMRRKVENHIKERGDGWQTIEAPIDVVSAISSCTPGDVILFDCATMWLSNIMLAERDIRSDTEILLNTLAKAPCPIVIISNEVGHGIVPDNRLGRSFREAQGKLNQQLAAQSETVVFVTAGLPMALKGSLPE